MLRTYNQMKLSEYGNLYDVVVPKDNLLRKVKGNIDFGFVNPMLKKQYCEAFGRPAKEPEMMFKIMFLKRMYDMSDEILVDDLGYNMAFKLEEMLAETMRQAIIVDSTHSYSKGNPETSETQIELAEYFPEKPTETVTSVTKVIWR